jgi:hypothetical protein
LAETTPSQQIKPIEPMMDMRTTHWMKGVLPSLSDGLTLSRV